MPADRRAFRASGLSGIAAELGDGDDRAATPTSGTVAGEAGDDTLTVAGAADGGAGDDVLICGGLPSQILSGCTLEGGSGRDQISGGAGADVLSGGPAIDELDGGDGSDVLDLSGHRKRVAVDLDAAVQVASVGGVREPIRGFEAVHGGSGDDTLISPTGVSFNSLLPGSFAMTGGAGDDRMQVRSPIAADGGDGDDRLTGGRDRNSMRGGSGRDVLDGRAGRDLLDGGAGDDVVRGGSQSDALYGSAGPDRVTAGSGNDHVWVREPATRASRDRVNCGPGRRDRANRDRKDRLSACERPKPRRRLG